MSSTSLPALFADANDKINKLYNWFCANKLYLNAGKTKYIVKSPPNKHIVTNSYTVSIGGTVIERIGDDMPEQAVKFLGIHIDEHLTWNAHIKHVKSKISKSLFSIKQ